ncbi:MAG: glycosyltransferase family 4 protein [Actinomycetota bacterium]
MDPPPATSPRALLVTNDFPPKLGGMERFALGLATALPGAAVLAAAHPDVPAHDRALPFPVHRAPTRFMLPTPGTAALIERVARAERADVVVLLAPLPLAGLGPRLALPWTVVAHGAELTVPARLPGLGALLRRWLGAADGLFAVSGHTAGQLRHLLGPHGPPVRLLHNGVDVERFHPSADGAAIRRRLGLGDGPLVGCVGRLVPRKGQDRLLAAMPLVREHVPDARLLLVGDGRLRRRLERQARAQGPGRVVLAGAVASHELPSYVAAMDVLAHPNRSRWAGLEQEGFGVVFLEGQACGRPVIAGDSGGSPEALAEGVSGLLVDGTDPAAIAEAIVAILTDTERAEAMGRAGRALVEARFTWSAIAERLLADLRGVLADAGTRPT